MLHVVLSIITIVIVDYIVTNIIAAVTIIADIIVHSLGTGHLSYIDALSWQQVGCIESWKDDKLRILKSEY